MKSDIEIARSIELTKIKQVARDYDIPVDEISSEKAGAIAGQKRAFGLSSCWVALDLTYRK